jgi:hypothetical protein
MLRRRSSSRFGEPFGRMETPPFRMPSFFRCISYAEVNIVYSAGARIMNKLSNAKRTVLGVLFS